MKIVSSVVPIEGIVLPRMGAGGHGDAGHEAWGAGGWGGSGEHMGGSGWETNFT